MEDKNVLSPGISGFNDPAHQVPHGPQHTHEYFSEDLYGETEQDLDLLIIGVFHAVPVHGAYNVAV